MPNPEETESQFEATQKDQGQEGEAPQEKPEKTHEETSGTSEKEEEKPESDLERETKKLEAELKEKVPDCGKYLPQYQCVEKIPDSKTREGGIKYFNDPDLMTEVKYTDLLRILKGEKSVTDTPVVKLKGGDIQEQITEKAMQEIASGKIRGADLEEMLKKGFQEAENKELIDLVTRGAAYNFSKNRIETIKAEDLPFPQKVREKIKEMRKEGFKPEGLYSHEDTHAYLAQQSKDGRERIMTLQEAEAMRKKRKELQKASKEREKLLMELEMKYRGKTLDDYYPEEASEEEKKKLKGELLDIIDKVDTDEELSRLTKEAGGLYAFEAELRIKKRTKKDLVALHEGLAFAVESHYSGQKFESFEPYKPVTSPKSLKKANKICNELISKIGVDASKDFVVDVLDEAYDKKKDAVKLLEKRFKEMRKKNISPEVEQQEEIKEKDLESREDPRKFLEFEKLTQPNENLTKLAESLRGETEGKTVESILSFLEENLENINLEKKNRKEWKKIFGQRSTQEIIESKKSYGCIDTTALFVSLSRICGIPTKFIEGKRIRKSGSHCWAEVLIDGKWVDVDPTQGIEGIEFKPDESKHGPYVKISESLGSSDSLSAFSYEAWKELEKAWDGKKGTFKKNKYGVLIRNLERIKKSRIFLKK